MKILELQCVHLLTMNIVKIIYQFPKQTNPEHYHKIKEETFILIEGDLVVNVDEKNTQFK